jgi:hypothetical protein
MAKKIKQSAKSIMRNKTKKRSSDRTFGFLLFLMTTVGAVYLYANSGPAELNRGNVNVISYLNPNE